MHIPLLRLVEVSTVVVACKQVVAETHMLQSSCY